MSKQPDHDKTLTIQVFKNHLNPRTFKVPSQWFTLASLLAWMLLGLTLSSIFYAIKENYSERSAQPTLVSELENEVQQLKIALEKKGDISAASNTVNQPTANTNKPDPLASDEKPPVGPGVALEGKDGTWGGLAEGITLPQAGVEPTVKLEDVKLDWQGKYANFYAGVMYRDPGKGSQQGHIVVLARGAGHITVHPENALNVGSGDHLFQPGRGEYFSVSRFRPLKAHLGPFESPSQLSEVQVYIFDLNNKLLSLRTFKYGK